VNPDLWDQRYHADETPYGEVPSRFLVEQLPRLGPPGLAWLPGDGGGRNGVWLASRGWTCTSLDYSPVGIQRAREHAARRGVSLQTRVADVTTCAWPEAELDLVAAIYLHLPSTARAHVHHAMARALKPGGHVLIEGFSTEQLDFRSGGPKDADLLFTEEGLRRDFAALEIRELRHEQVDLDESDLHRGHARLIRLLARRPR
jgi:SAM-dependent methyltransferase